MPAPGVSPNAANASQLIRYFSLPPYQYEFLLRLRVIYNMQDLAQLVKKFGSGSAPSGGMHEWCLLDHAQVFIASEMQQYAMPISQLSKS